MERLQKYLARAGISSRRAAEQLILDGRVKVNGETVTTLGTKVDASKDLIVMDGAPVVASNERQWYLFYKPPGVVTTMSDPQGRPTVGEYVERLEGRVFPVGRLDYDAEGALLLTDDGETANMLMHPRHQVPRVYLAKVKGSPDDASLEKLRGGVRLEDGPAKPTEVLRFEKAEKNTWLKIVVTEGRPHLVKRLCAAIGHPVVRLYRPQHAGIGVEGVKPGEFRRLTVEEVKMVKAAAGGRSGPATELRLPARRHGHGAASDDSPARPSGRAMSEREDAVEERPDEGAAPRERTSTGGRSGVVGPPRGGKPRAAPASTDAETGEAKPFRAPRFGAAFKSRDEAPRESKSRGPARVGEGGRSSRSEGGIREGSRGGARARNFAAGLRIGGTGEGTDGGGHSRTGGVGARTEGGASRTSRSEGGASSRSGGFSDRTGTASRSGSSERSEGGSRGGGRTESARGSRSGGFSDRKRGGVRGENSSARGSSARSEGGGDALSGFRARAAAKASEGPRDSGFRGRSATGDDGGGSFDTSRTPSSEVERGSIRRGTSADARRDPAGGYKGTGTPTGRDKFSTRKAGVKGAFGRASKGPRGKAAPRSGGKGGPRGGR